MARIGVIGGGAFGAALAVDQVLNHGADIEEAIARLLAHPYHFDRIIST